MILSGNSLEHLLVSLAAYAAGAPGNADQRRLLADEQRPRADQGDRGADRARARVRRRRRAVRRRPRRARARQGARGARRARGVRCASTKCWKPPLEDDSPLDGEPGPKRRSPNSYSHQDRPASPRGSSTPTGCCARTRRRSAPCWPFLADEPPILVDWLPWSHTFGGNHNLNLALFNGGTIYIDDGKPAPPLFPRTLAALRDVPPTLYFNVPAGYALLAPALENDAALAERFFSRLRFMFYAAAALPEALAARLRELASRPCRPRGAADLELGHDRDLTGRDHRALPEARPSAASAFRTRGSRSSSRRCRTSSRSA